KHEEEPDLIVAVQTHQPAIAHTPDELTPTSVVSDSDLLPADMIPPAAETTPHPEPTHSTEANTSSSTNASSTISSSSSSSTNSSKNDKDKKLRKVNFWSWVDVGFSHHPQDYDRTPLEPEPLTREAAVEVIQMRLEMRKITTELYKWREDYEAFLANNNSNTSKSESEIMGAPPAMPDTRPSFARESNEFQQKYPPLHPTTHSPPTPRRPQYPHPTYPPVQTPRTSTTKPSHGGVQRRSTISTSTPSPEPPQAPLGILERPHSHHSTTTTTTASNQPQTKPSTTSQSSNAPAPVRWSWNEAMAAKHRDLTSRLWTPFSRMRPSAVAEKKEEDEGKENKVPPAAVAAAAPAAVAVYAKQEQMKVPERKVK
ncbi:hypothetical protein HDV05_002712, partial [Chytridiales sp. JEL 0842]